MEGNAGTTVSWSTPMRPSLRWWPGRKRHKARPSSSIRKSCARTSPGVRHGCDSRSGVPERPGQFRLPDVHRDHRPNLGQRHQNALGNAPRGYARRAHTATVPPCCAACTSNAASNRCLRSSRCGDRDKNRAPITVGSLFPHATASPSHEKASDPNRLCYTNNPFALTFTLPSRHCEPLVARQSRAASAVFEAGDRHFAALLAMTETVGREGSWYYTNGAPL